MGSRAPGPGLSERRPQLLDVAEMMADVVYRVARDPMDINHFAADGGVRTPAFRFGSCELLGELPDFLFEHRERMRGVDRSRRWIEARLRWVAQVYAWFSNRHFENQPHPEGRLSDMVGVLGYRPHLGNGATEEIRRTDAFDCLRPQGRQLGESHEGLCVGPVAAVESALRTALNTHRAGNPSSLPGCGQGADIYGCRIARLPGWKRVDAVELDEAAPFPERPGCHIGLVAGRSVQGLGFDQLDAIEGERVASIRWCKSQRA